MRWNALLFLSLLTVGLSAQAQHPLDIEYREAAGRLISAAMVDRTAYDRLAYLTTQIGPRLSGSRGLELAAGWMAQEMKADGLQNVRLQPVKVPYWVRGNESAKVVKPIEKPLNVLGLGDSSGTPPEGITASVIVVGSFEELDRLAAEKIKGKIVLYDMPWQGYPRTARYRRDGASRAARHGAVAGLLRSITPRSLYTPHTGALAYDSESPKIPAAAVTVEDAAWIRQMVASGQDVQVRLQMDANTLPDGDSANVIGEIVGRERPDEVVVIGGHLDSWDVGQGAHDDGAGVLAAWRAVTLMKELGLTPRRTIRVVAWTNEENGARGGAAYRDAVGADVSRHVAAIEMDEGAEGPVGFAYAINGLPDTDPRMVKATATLREIARLLDSLGVGSIETGGGETDIGPLMRAGVPGFGLHTVNEHYFDWHHSNADTFDKIDLQDFRKCIASLAVLTYALAEMPDRL